MAEETHFSEADQPGNHNSPNGDSETGATVGGIGGVLVGLAAGAMAGPIGAVIGAVIGGVAGATASGVAVAAIDHIDHIDHIDNHNTALGSGRNDAINSAAGDLHPEIHPTELLAYRVLDLTSPPLLPAESLPRMPVDLRPQIAARAYQLYEQRGHRDGQASRDWLDAEHQIRKN